MQQDSLSDFYTEVTAPAWPLVAACPHWHVLLVLYPPLFLQVPWSNCTLHRCISYTQECRSLYWSFQSCETLWTFFGTQPQNHYSNLKCSIGDSYTNSLCTLPDIHLGRHCILSCILTDEMVQDMASQDRQWQSAATGEGHSVSLHFTFPASHSYHLPRTSPGTFLGISVMDMWGKIKTSRFFPQYPEMPRKGTKKLMPVPTDATDLPPSTDRDAAVTAHLSMLRTSFNTKNNPKATLPQNGTECRRYGRSLHQALQASLRAERKEPRNRLQIFSSCITADISPCSYKTPPCRIPEPRLPGFCDLHIPGIQVIAVLWDLLKSCQKVTDKPPSSAARKENFTTLARHTAMESGPCFAPSQYPQSPSPLNHSVNVVSSSASQRRATGSARVTPAALHHDSSCRTTSTQLCRHHLICILGRSYRAPVKIWPYPEQTKNYIR